MTRIVVDADALIAAQAGSAEAGDRARSLETELTLSAGHAARTAVRSVVGGVNASAAALGRIRARIGDDGVDRVTA